MFYAPQPQAPTPNNGGTFGSFHGLFINAPLIMLWIGIVVAVVVGVVALVVCVVVFYQ